jgi:hypothetical protein
MNKIYPTPALPGNAVTPLPEIHYMTDKFDKGARSLTDPLPPMQHAPFTDVFRTRYSTDAHFVAYQIIGPNGVPQLPIARLTKSVLPQIRQTGADVVLTCLVLDFDNPGHALWQPGGPRVFRERLQAATTTFPLAMGFTLFYSTLHGARLVYVLTRPVPVEEGEKRHRGLCQQFQANGFPEIDMQTSDWTRLFRLPYVIRADGGK